MNTRRKLGWVGLFLILGTLFFIVDVLNPFTPDPVVIPLAYFGLLLSIWKIAVQKWATQDRLKNVSSIRIAVHPLVMHLESRALTCCLLI